MYLSTAPTVVHRRGHHLISGCSQLFTHLSIYHRRNELFTYSHACCFTHLYKYFSHLKLRCPSNCGINDILMYGHTLCVCYLHVTICCCTWQPAPQLSHLFNTCLIALFSVEDPVVAPSLWPDPKEHRPFNAICNACQFATATALVLVSMTDKAMVPPPPLDPITLLKDSIPLEYFNAAIFTVSPSNSSSLHMCTKLIDREPAGSCLGHPDMLHARAECCRYMWIQPF